MPHSVEISDRTFSRLQQHAIPLVDKIEDVIVRLLTAANAATAPGAQQEAAAEPSKWTEVFSAGSPPDLKHTKVTSAELDGQLLPKSDTNWNGLLRTAVRRAKANSRSESELRQLLIVNSIIGRKEDEGYFYLEDVRISVQGQDSAGAWTGAHHIFRELKIPFRVHFIWRAKDDAAFPGKSGHFMS